MLELFAMVLRICFALNALVQSGRSRFFLGVAGAAAHAPAVLVVTLASGASVAGGPDEARSFSLVDGLFFVIPAISVAVTVVAYLRARDAPAADEERMHRPVPPWLSVLATDVIATVLALTAESLSNP